MVRDVFSTVEEKEQFVIHSKVKALSKNRTNRRLCMESGEQNVVVICPPADGFGKCTCYA